MRKILLSIFIVLALVLTSINVFAIDPTNKIKITEENEKFIFSKLSISSDEEYIDLEIAETNNFLNDPGCPRLPFYTKTYVFPLGTKILDVTVSPKEIFEKRLEGKIKPASENIPKINLEKYVESEDFIDWKIYESSDLYPNKWFDYKITRGIKNNERVTFLTVYLYPVRYIPSESIVYQTTSIDLNIRYSEPSLNLKFSEEYDMVVIAPENFSKSLEPLIDHKNHYGMKTILNTTEDIYNDFPGRDEAEKIKYFIKFAIEKWGIQYVLLVGGRMRQSLDWHLPARYSYLDDWGLWEEFFVSDLYFSDIYRYNETSAGYEFDTWDSDGDGIFSEWYRSSIYPQDVIDLVPDVYIGRLPCRNRLEVGTIVDKIITYETSTYGEDWFKRMILVGGDTAPNSNPYYEGEIETEYGGSFMEPLGFELTRLFASTGTLKNQRSLISAISKGAGFLFLSGHGNPTFWSTHPPNSDDETWIDALKNKGMRYLRNKEKLPITVVGGCHNSQFDVCLSNLMVGFLNEGFDYFSNDLYYDSGGFWKVGWASECWSWNLVKQRDGGSIATIGNTGLGFGDYGYLCLERNDGWITTHFFKVYSEESLTGNNTLGQIHSQAITDYINEFGDTWDRQDGKTVEGWALLGDPSLMIGGYPPIS